MSLSFLFVGPEHRENAKRNEKFTKLNDIKCAADGCIIFFLFSFWLSVSVHFPFDRKYWIYLPLSLANGTAPNDRITTAQKIDCVKRVVGRVLAYCTHAHRHSQSERENRDNYFIFCKQNWQNDAFRVATRREQWDTHTQHTYKSAECIQLRIQTKPNQFRVTWTELCIYVWRSASYRGSASAVANVVLWVAHAIHSNLHKD